MIYLFSREFLNGFLSGGNQKDSFISDATRLRQVGGYNKDKFYIRRYITMQAKRKAVTLCASVLALTAVVGAGFSAWVFVDEGVKATTKLGIEITATSAEAGKITVDDGTYRLKLDQVEKSNEEKGISVVDGNGQTVSSISAVWTIDADQYEIIGTSSTFWVRVFVDESSASGFSKYVRFAGTGYTDAKENDSTFTDEENELFEKGYAAYDLQLGTPTEGTETGENEKQFTMEYTIAENLFQYYGKADPDNGKLAKPQSVDEYKTMVDAIMGENTYQEDNQNGYEGSEDYTPVIFEFYVKF